MICHHIGIVCKNIDKELIRIRKLYDVQGVSNIVFDENQNASVCMIWTRHGVNLELVSGKRVEKLAHQGVSYYHICYTVADIDRQIEQLRMAGAILVSEPKPAPLFDNRLVAFLHTSTGLIELLEDA